MLFRSNQNCSDAQAFAERSWPGKCLRIGTVLIGVQDLRGRCVMTTFDPDTLEQNHHVLKEIVQKFGGELALNCYVIHGGEIHVGDAVQLLADDEGEMNREPLAKSPALTTDHVGVTRWDSQGIEQFRD